MVEIANFRIEKQAGAELCWAAAVKSVLDHYLPANVSPTQAQLWARFGKMKDGQFLQANDPEKVLLRVGALHSVERFTGSPDEESGLYPILKLKIADHIRSSNPIVLALSGAGASSSFKHSVVIWRIDDMPNSAIYFVDPARPDSVIRVVLEDIMTGSWNYAFDIQYTKLYAYATKFMFTQKPGSISLAAAGLIER